MRAAFIPKAAAVLLLGAIAVVAHAQSTPVGVWKTIDDDTKKEASLIRITESGGVVSGKIEKLLDPANPPDATCEKCTGDRKNKPIVGMTIITGAKPSGSDKAVWVDGEILDPGNGKTYKLKLTLIDSGKALEVRGYIGVPMLGRTQTWLRVE